MCTSSSFHSYMWNSLSYHRSVGTTEIVWMCHQQKKRYSDHSLRKMRRTTYIESESHPGSCHPSIRDAKTTPLRTLPRVRLRANRANPRVENGLILTIRDNSHAAFERAPP